MGTPPIFCPERPWGTSSCGDKSPPVSRDICSHIGGEWRVGGGLRATPSGGLALRAARGGVRVAQALHTHLPLQTPAPPAQPPLPRSHCSPRLPPPLSLLSSVSELPCASGTTGPRCFLSPFLFSPVPGASPSRSFPSSSPLSLAAPCPKPSEPPCLITHPSNSPPSSDFYLSPLSHSLPCLHLRLAGPFPPVP